MLLFCSIFYETVVNTNSYQQCYGSLIKWKVKYITFLFDKLLIFLRVLFGGKVSDGTVFVSLSYDVVRVAKFSDGVNFITCNHWIVNITSCLSTVFKNT